MSVFEGADLTNRMRDLVLADFAGEPDAVSFPGKAPWAAVARCGSDLWLDTGDIEAASALWCEQFSAVTTNNTLLNREVQKGTYDELIEKAAEELAGEVPPEDVPLEIAFVLNAYHALKISRKLGAMVSVELHTDLAHDVERSVWYGRRYHEIAPDRFYVKVPLTPAGLLAARRLGEDGVPVNCTLGFSARQNHLIASVARPSFVNVFLGRLNGFVADNGLGTGEMVGEKATLASQREVAALRRELGLRTRQIAASMRDGGQVRSLAGVDVLTMPTGVAEEFEELAPEPAEITSQVDHDPGPGIEDGVDAEELGITSLWEVTDELKRAVQDLVAQEVNAITPPGICAFFAERGLPDLLPEWSEAHNRAAVEDGKIPALDRWRDRLLAGEVALDALMNLSGLHSFATDQKAMDERVREIL